MLPKSGSRYALHLCQIPAEFPEQRIQVPEVLTLQISAPIVDADRLGFNFERHQLRLILVHRPIELHHFRSGDGSIERKAILMLDGVYTWHRGRTAPRGQK